MPGLFLCIYERDFLGNMREMPLGIRTLIWLFCCAAPGVSFSSAAGADAYLHSIKPVLKARCYACHGALKQKAGLRLDTAEFIRKGGKSGSVISAGGSESSRLIARLTSSDESERMPPEAEPLSAEQIGAIKAWLNAGAPIPAEEQPEADPRDHWAYRPVIRPAIPLPAADGSAIANPIDAFLAGAQTERGLKPQSPAPKSILLRRAHLDLIGLPPTRDELAAFRSSDSERAYEHLIDRLLASPHYGERWGRHWMDVWRYTDWYGLGKQLRNSQKHIWHWRDWIVESLNEDKGYDRMILEMLAGDEIAPTDRDTLRATGFLARNYYLFNRDSWLDNTIEHTAKAFLGLTMNCAKCHDHKYDPIEQVDFYAFRAFFEPHQVRLDQEPGVLDYEKDGLPRVFDDHLDAPTYLYRKGDDKDPDKSKVIEPELPRIFSNYELEIEPVELPAFAFAPGSRDYVAKDFLARSAAVVAQARESLVGAKARLAKLEEQDQERSESPSTAPTPFLKDDFSKPRLEIWEIAGDGWKHAGGNLIQSKPGTGEYLRSKAAHPSNFRAVFRYKITGGVKWKSITLRFDLKNDGKDGHTAYLSATAGGAKAQISHVINGRNEYPASGRKDMPIKEGELYEFEITVRDRVINVTVDGELALAYALPFRHPGGRIEVSAFDATAEFHSLEVTSLASDVRLAQPGGLVGSSSIASAFAGAEAAVTLAEKTLEHASLSDAALKARIAADTARFVKSTSTSDSDALSLAAATAENETATAKAELESIQAEQDLTRLRAMAKPDKAKLAAADKKAKAAKAVWSKAVKAVGAEDREYVSLTGSMKALEGPSHKQSQYAPVYSRASTGRRTALAGWIGDRQNPLTARVAVNHVWMRHFGEPLVEQVFDFGRRAKRPEHLELLDYLAADFMEHGWSMKRLHKLIMTSEAYRRSSSNAGAAAATLAADPTNQNYWRMNPRRMESQIVRDSALHLAGSLETRMGGPTINPNVKDTARRRSLYFTQSRDHGLPFLKSFDDADFNQCYRRSESVVPLQALALANAELALETADRIASRSLNEPGMNDESLVNLAFETVLTRGATQDELAESRKFLQEMRALLKQNAVADPEPRARARLVHVLLNHNDFITIR